MEKWQSESFFCFPFYPRVIGVGLISLGVRLGVGVGTAKKR